ncbi:MAG: DNA-protecting protein DprA [Actinobacteria bacterium HGW-Actinobacteria-7]|jgi:DNA processing protein|nr:MAG: DNA-protecting protein DprA [Actinobacteria bacterium HGW-Actinobacteria-7]
MNWCEDLSRFELHIGESGYPEQLAESPDPPPVLYGLGDPCSLAPGLGVVGARKSTPYGLAAAQYFAGWAGGAGYVVVSGGAIGCDQAAHRAALASGGRSVAVMAGGADVHYPRSASSMLRAIATNGAVVSEHPWGTQPQKWTFRTRNRIIAGLSMALLVLEAALGSGTFSTADYALAAGRDVLAIPGSIYAPECAGANRLIRQGATPITDADELCLALEGLLGPPARDPTPWAPASAGGDDPVLAAVRTNPQRPDDLARALGLDVVTIVRLLGVMETTGQVVRFRDGRYGPR